MKNVVLLGSTGSVGKNVLNIVRAYPDKFRISGIAAGEDINLLGAQVEEFKPDVAVIGNKNLYSDFKTIVSGETKILSGIEGVGQLASGKETDIVFMAISGIQALDPLIAAITAGKTVALASKEPIVSAGALIKKLEKEHNARILPVDSEHSAIMQCLCGRNIEDVNKLYITGSGGSLFGVEKDKFDELSVETVLNHPKWDMGRKITVDSATLMNKGLELIEARWLFNVLPEKIKIIIHPEAIIHSMVEFIDGTISASLFCPDMRFPILRALSYPDIVKSDLPRVDFSVTNNFSFGSPDEGKFPALKVAFDALEKGGTVPAVLNSANEKAVNMFLEEKIKFTDIVRIVEEITEKHKRISEPLLEDIISAHKWAAEEVLRLC